MFLKEALSFFGDPATAGSAQGAFDKGRSGGWPSSSASGGRSSSSMAWSPAIPGLTEPLVGTREAQRNTSLTRFKEAKLLTVNREEGSGVLLALDAHPLLREYFARRLRRQQPEAWRTAHRRLYEHLCTTT